MKIERSEILKRLEELKGSGSEYLVKITAVDYAEYIELVYIVRNIDSSVDTLLEVDLDPSDLCVESVMHIYPAADWYERELSEMFGIRLRGRKTRRLLLEKWDGKGYPLRKGFGWNAPYEKID